MNTDVYFSGYYNMEPETSVLHSAVRIKKKADNHQNTSYQSSLDL